MDCMKSKKKEISAFVVDCDNNVNKKYASITLIQGHCLTAKQFNTMDMSKMNINFRGPCCVVAGGQWSPQSIDGWIRFKTDLSA